MIKSLKFSVVFPSTGKTLSGEHNFLTGMTTITGENEKGKSFRLEMIRYALFGTKALRSSASDYKGLYSELEFEVRGKAYRIIRKGGKSDIFQGEDPLATGTRPVNDKVIELLGYDLTAFDVANSCQQGQVEALGDMKPTERRAMVDQTIGLDVLDKVIKILGENASVNAKAAETMEDTLVQPTAPETPEGYRPSGVVRTEANELYVKVKRHDEIKVQLQREPISAPVRPVSPETTRTIEELSKQQDLRGELLVKRGTYQGQLQTLGPVTEWTENGLLEIEQQRTAFDHYKVKLVEANNNPTPRFTLKQLQEAEEAHRQSELLAQREDLKLQISKLEKCGDVECPECSTIFPVEVDRLTPLRKQLEDFPEINIDLSKTLGLTPAQIAVEQEKVKNYIPTEVPERVVEPLLSVNQIADLRRSVRDNAKRGEVNQLLHDLEIQLKDVPDVSELLNSLHKYEREVVQYDNDLQRYNADQEQRAAMQEETLKYKGCHQKWETLAEQAVRFVDYETRLATFTDLDKAYRTQSDELEGLRNKSDQYRLAQKALKALKTRVKTYLVPSLNRVASHLLNQMTNGARTIVAIDEDFDIQIDGQPLSTLSGSGKAVANLAIRIGLGQVLTNKVFSVFLGDEIDASMDDNRANYTAQCIRNLTSTIDQILIVTHKQIEADRTIQL
ncbi:hypothetical protein [Kiloniella sp.]|uniref:hypothetical protein n=1 Tax=Kiloniella sp. TaxID=1938587 RepID=UPI003B012546